MFRHKKSLYFTFLTIACVSSVFSQKTDSDEGAVLLDNLLEVTADSNVSTDEQHDSDMDEDLDSLFDDAEDTEHAVVKEEVKAGTDYNVQIGSIKFPIEVSGHLAAELGGAYVRQKDDDDGTFYFDFKNYIYFTTRPDKYLALKGVLKSSMPRDTADSETNNMLYLYELYFDYLMFDKIYVTAGKKKSVWGNIRLFSNSSDYSGDTDALSTNVLYDSRDYISGIVRIPWGNHTFTGVAMYNEATTTNSPETKDMSLAASAEFIVFSTSINFFGRRFPLASGSDAKNNQPPILGMEVKRTFFGFDIYGQSMARVSDYKKLKSTVKSKFEDKDSISKIISTAGIYRLWSDNPPYFGFNFEFQNIYRPEPDEGVDKITNRFAFDFGMSKLGPNRDIKLGFQWNHDITNRIGFVQSGIIFSRIMPHCDWRNGVKYEYGDTTSFNKYKLTLGSYISITLDY